MAEKQNQSFFIHPVARKGTRQIDVCFPLCVCVCCSGWGDGDGVQSLVSAKQELPTELYPRPLVGTWKPGLGTN